MSDIFFLHLDGAGVIEALPEKTGRHEGPLRALRSGVPLVDFIHVNDRIALLSLLADMRHEQSAAPCHVRVMQDLPQNGFVTLRLDAVSLPAKHDGGSFMIAARHVQAKDPRREMHDTRQACQHMLAAAGHELRTPLNAVIGFSDMLLHEDTGYIDEERRREYLALIRQSGQHLLSVVEAMLDSARLENNNYVFKGEDIEIHDAVRFACSVVAQQAEKRNIIIDDHLIAENHVVRADRRALQQILVNLLSNAVKFSHAGSIVRIAAHCDDARGLFEFYVDDNGIGIAADDLARIGQPFVQVKRLYDHAGAPHHDDGVGLGLSLVRGLVDLHQGELVIESTPGQGTRVIIRLPLSGPDSKSVPDDTQAETMNIVTIPSSRTERNDGGQSEQEQETENAPNRKTA